MDDIDLNLSDDEKLGEEPEGDGPVVKPVCCMVGKTNKIYMIYRRAKLYFEPEL